jgi:hypothetical protein
METAPVRFRLAPEQSASGLLARGTYRASTQIISDDEKDIYAGQTGHIALVHRLDAHSQSCLQTFSGRLLLFAEVKARRKTPK